MTDLLSPARTLDTNVALACHLIRTDSVLRTYLRWSVQPETTLRIPQSPSQPILDSLTSLLEPIVAKSAKPADLRLNRQGTSNASRWIASTIEYAFSSRIGGTRHWKANLLAAALLPLYRAALLETPLPALVQTRGFLREMLLICKLFHDLDLWDWGEESISRRTTPMRLLRECLDIDLPRIDRHVANLIVQFDDDSGDFDQIALEELSNATFDDFSAPVIQPDEWDSPETLWLLANELNASKPDLMVPRSWIDLPAAWSVIGDHWSTLIRTVASAPLDSHKDSPRRDKDDVRRDTSFCDAATHCGTGTANELEEPFFFKEEEAIAPGDAIEPKANEGTGKHGSSEPKIENQSAPKMMVGEITDLQDLEFISALRRQIANCRVERRPLCLSMIEVISDGDFRVSGLSAMEQVRLNEWQQRLICWLLEHFHTDQTTAYVTQRGQLLLTTLDHDRQEMTTLLRRGLQELLQFTQEFSVTDFHQTSVGAQFHAGIASTSQPSTSLDADDLINAVDRCLQMARRMGRQSIKSIEVF
jgi:hypothetical protein